MPTESVSVRRQLQLSPDTTRVIAKLFMPGQEDVSPTGSRVRLVADRVLALPEAEVESACADVLARFSTRHRDLRGILERHAGQVMDLIDDDRVLSESRRLLIGSVFTHEYAVEAAALANPSMVAHPVQDIPGATRFVMSVRGIGEGHRSSIGFRAGTISADGAVAIDPPCRFTMTSTASGGTHHRSVYTAKLDSRGHDRHQIDELISRLPERFDDAGLARAIAAFPDEDGHAAIVVSAEELARWSYRIDFPDDTQLSERLLWPSAPPEFHGMEDARFTRFTADDGTVTYFATYTAFDRAHISQQLLETVDFQHFESAPLAGPAAVGKGLALFPRLVGGRFAALTRCDWESNGVAYSDDARYWNESTPIHVPSESWEVIQVGNCGPPIEIDDGWLVLIHGVGPLRTYSIGALLLDLDDPTIVLARTLTPFISPQAGQQDGYVPNVVYSCGALKCGDTLVIPYGVADESIEIATVSITALVASMHPEVLHFG